jgi:thiol:disulfide interchange protein DsbD
MSRTHRSPESPPDEPEDEDVDTDRFIRDRSGAVVRPILVQMKLALAARRRFVAGGALLVGLLLAGTAHAAETFAEASARGVGAAFLFAFTFGFLTSLTPCVYPMIPITVSIFGAKTGVSRLRALLLATCYVAGISTMFGALGTTFALLGKAFGTFLANPWVVVPIALFFTAMALSMFGAFELSLPQGLQERLNRVGGRGFGGAFLMGLVGGIIAAPCTGPPLAGILAYVTTTRDAVRGFELLATYGAGIGVPVWAIAGFSMSLPRSGPWMESVKSVFGIVLLVAALFYLKNVVPVLGHLTGTKAPFILGCVGVVVLGAAIGAVHLSFHDRMTARARKTGGIALMVVGLFALTNVLLTPKVELRWLHSETEALAAARKSGHPMLVDFGADWCDACHVLEVKVFGQPEVARVMAEHFTLLHVDCTREGEDPSIGEIRQRYQAGGGTLPSVRVVSPNGNILASTDDAYISPQGFVKLLAKAVHCDSPSAAGALVADCSPFN